MHNSAIAGDSDQTGPENLTDWARCWYTAASAAFLGEYRKMIAVNAALLPPAPECQPLFAAYMLEKALYELIYELNNRPAWVRIPLAGILNT
jgi:maltose alpha-D-glucosyltransferase/alpha-amylase